MSGDDTLTRVCSLLVVAVDELRAIRSELSGRKAAKNPRALSGDDIKALTPLLPEISGAVGDEKFSVRAVSEYADAHQAQEGKLVDAIKSTGTRRQFSELLSRAAKSEQCVAGLFVHRYPRKRDGVLFSVDTNTASHHTASCVAAALSGEFNHDY